MIRLFTVRPGLSIAERLLPSLLEMIGISEMQLTGVLDGAQMNEPHPIAYGRLGEPFLDALASGVRLDHDVDRVVPLEDGGISLLVPVACAWKTESQIVMEPERVAVRLATSPSENGSPCSL
jgi:hypothetical protein